MKDIIIKLTGSSETLPMSKTYLLSLSRFRQHEKEASYPDLFRMLVDQAFLLVQTEIEHLTCICLYVTPEVKEELVEEFEYLLCINMSSKHALQWLDTMWLIDNNRDDLSVVVLTDNFQGLNYIVDEENVVSVEGE